eukprot:scaffold795_cov375-Prasinococcus_capsulatus_cf.AAC.4
MYGGLVQGALKFMTGRVDLLKTVPTTAAASNGDSLAKISQEQSEDKLADMQQQMEEKERLLKEKLKALGARAAPCFTNLDVRSRAERVCPCPCH